ncbi:filamentation induced by cAMP protein Fic [Hymenobacter roseosalivarius DSM 11622]|uniref:Filamentation induced by cAMP protein Fic n=1 Tax=Hymenobacter roseosalivarius DSM 11622 TaxID=645990 RepID=A0A1W1W4R1_9BACT|nr:Fic family protein [Hymenobacter roseosalivarius]SMC00632.1 filamentation induced by cAMP protein Fic [Hymenobacter roseosalivarius DSM 11622]
MGHYTDAPEDNLRGITTKEELNEQEALGVATVERFLLEEMEYPVVLSVQLVQELHRRAFAHLYDWAGQWRTQVPNVGAYLPPAAHRVPQLLYEFMDELRYRQQQLPIPDQQQVAALLAYAHHRLVAIHPFTNGNGRTARLFTNLLAYNYGYQEVVLYQREQGESRTAYLQAIRQGDEYDLGPLEQLISGQLRPL